MTRVLVIVKHPSGPRVFVVHRRVHHGFVGCLAVALGLALAWQDRRDWREWLFKEALK